MKFSSRIGVIFLLCSALFLLPIRAKRSFGIQRRQKSGKSFSARRGGANASPDNSPIPPPKKPEAPQSTITKTSANAQNAPAPGWNTNGPQGPGLGHQGAPPAYSPSYSNPPGYSAYPQPGHSGAYMGAPMGAPMGASMPMNGYPAQSVMGPSKSGSGFSVGSLLMGMAAGHAVSSVVGGLGGRRHHSETHIHHHYDTSKEQDTGSVDAPQENLPQLVTPDPVFLDTAEQPQFENNNQEASTGPQVDTIYSFNYAPSFKDSVQTTFSSSESSDESTDTSITTTVIP